jgi:hypothetical protein
MTRLLFRRLLLFVLIPIWELAGLADWWCHRRTDIEHTSGWRESIFHLVMLGEGSVPVFIGLFAKPSPAALVFTYLATAVHTATAWWDVAFTAPQRRITDGEDRVHLVLQVVPALMAAGMSAVWPQATKGLVHRERAPESLEPASRRELPPASGVIALLLCAALLTVLPHAEEFLRCVTTRPE